MSHVNSTTVAEINVHVSMQVHIRSVITKLLNMSCFISSLPKENGRVSFIFHI